MTHRIQPSALSLLGLLGSLTACGVDCPEGQVVAGDRQGTRQMCVAASDASSTGDTTDTTSDTTTDAPPCDDDPACGPDEDAVRCPAQCNTCGDGILFGDETCDNGSSNQTYWPGQPPEAACSEACDHIFRRCGDATLDDPDGEACDNGSNDDPAHTPSEPAPDACAPGCTAVRFCGDATLDAPDGEACDDGNNTDGDGCSADCLHPERLVFVSSTTYKGDLNQAADNPQKLTGLALADARCQALATKAGLSGTFKAWLSTTTDGPATRFDTRFTGLYRLSGPGNPILAAGWSALTTQPLLHPIDADENGAPASGEIVWTNTLPDGTPASNLHCNNWSSSKAIDTTTVGDSSQTDPTWTNLGAGQFCASTYRLYCFEDPT